MVRKLEKIAMCVRLREEDENDGSTTTTTESDASTFVFPHESEYEDMNSAVALERVSQQHGFPPVVALLCQPAPWRFREFFPASLFDDFLRRRVVLDLGGGNDSDNNDNSGAAVVPSPVTSLDAPRRRPLGESPTRVSPNVDACSPRSRRSPTTTRRQGVAGLIGQAYLVFTRVSTARMTVRRPRARARRVASFARAPRSTTWTR